MLLTTTTFNIVTLIATADIAGSIGGVHNTQQGLLSAGCLVKLNVHPSPIKVTLSYSFFQMGE
jgi:hypothetical protein